ncbi:hypothetical protein [uncultured Deefgea sp.]|uniref:hypothetical protein n=1 Tax=uncultured Deefgea sp. TaxID=1304914 RepID=UPI0026320780|nr:hypothetical protein [uncultured Deefgea sp.]
MHPVNFLALWLWLLLLLPWLERHYLWVLVVVVVLLAAQYARQRLQRSLSKLKWLLLFTALIYGWSTPGRYIWLGVLSPTDVGLSLGVDQVGRLLVVAASLQILLKRLTSNEVFSSFYLFLSPLQYFSNARARFAVRFALTLQVAESLLESKLDFKALLSLILQPQPPADQDLVLSYIPINRRQLSLLFGQCALIVYSIFLGMGGFWR